MKKSTPIFHCLRSYCIKNFVKNDQNFAVKALGCTPLFPSLVSLLFVAAPWSLSNPFQCDVISMSNSNFHPITGRKSETTIPRYIVVSLVSKTIGGSRYLLVIHMIYSPTTLSHWPAVSLWVQLIECTSLTFTFCWRQNPSCQQRSSFNKLAINWCELNVCYICANLRWLWTALPLFNILQKVDELIIILK